jgi:hypothetical protein
MNGMTITAELVTMWKETAAMTFEVGTAMANGRMDRGKL